MYHTEKSTHFLGEGSKNIFFWRGVQSYLYLYIFYILIVSLQAKISDMPFNKKSFWLPEVGVLQWQTNKDKQTDTQTDIGLYDWIGLGADSVETNFIKKLQPQLYFFFIFRIQFLTRNLYCTLFQSLGGRGGGREKTHRRTLKFLNSTRQEAVWVKIGT